MDVVKIRNRREKGKMRAGNETGNDVSEYKRLIELFKKNGSNACYQQNHSEVGNDWW